MDIKQTKYMRELRRIIDDKFSLNDVRVMAFEVAVDFDNLPGDNKKIKVLSLILHLSRRGRLEDLAEWIREERPELNLPDIPAPSRQVQDEKSLTLFASFQGYVEKITSLFDGGIFSEPSQEEDIEEIRNLTLRTLWGISSQEKVKIIYYLHSLGLINSEKPIISLSGANLFEAVFKWATLTDINLSGTSLAGANFEKSILQGAIFRNADLRNSRFKHVDLTGADLQSADLTESNFLFSDLKGVSFEEAITDFMILDEVDVDASTKLDPKLLLVNQLMNNPKTIRQLREVDLSGVFLSRVDLDGADLEGANMSKSVFEQARFVGANLTGADLRESILYNANLSLVNLRDADLRGADLRGASLSEAQLKDCKIDEVTKLDSIWLEVWRIVNNKVEIKNFRNVVFRHANFTGINLSGFDFQDADLRFCDFSHADLSNCNLRGANLANANLSGANVVGANLSGAELTFAKIENADFSGANLDNTNVYSEGFLIEQGARFSDDTIFQGGKRADEV